MAWQLPSPATQENDKRNIIQYLKKWEIFFRFVDLLAVWRKFEQNSVENTCLRLVQLDFPKKVAKQLKGKQNRIAGQKSNSKLFYSIMISIEFCWDCNETADK